MIITFGKYVGQDLEDIPDKYLKWITNNIENNDELVEEAEKELKFRDDFNKHIYE